MPIQDWRRLRSQLNQRQFGANEEQPQTEGSWLEGWDPDMPNAREEYLRRWDERYLPKVVGNAGMTEYIRNISSAPSESIADTMTPEQILATGYGQSKYDTNQPFSNWIQNPTDYRANAQSAASKFWNGTAKMVPYAVTTFLDDTAGLVAGLLNVGADAVNGGEFHPLKSFVDNPFSNWMQQARDWSEKVLPNYRTTEEMENQDRWWEHLNANFWGDTFIKNLGFTIGSAGSFLLYGGLAKKAMGTVANKAYKAAVAAAVDGDAAAEAAFQKVLQGAAMGTPENLPNIFSKLSNTYKNMKATTNMFAGVASAIGESRVEALQAAKEYKDEWNARLSQQYDKDREALEADINAKYSVDEPEYDGFGNVVGKRKVLSSEGEAALAEGYRKLQEKYQADMAAVENEATTLANYTFGLNMPILTASNIVMFGRTLSGGFDSQLKKMVKGTFGNYDGKGSKTLLGTAYALRNTATEGMEEMSQRVISDSMKNIASNNAAAFHNMKYDTQAIKGVSEWLSSVFDSTKETLRDPTAWEEFAVGALTGALGMPSRLGFRNWSGGILGGIQEANEQVERSRDMAKRMNDTARDEKFQRALQSAFLQENLNNIQNVALNSKIEGKDEVYKDKDGNPVGPKFVWKTADDAKLLDSVMLWADAGRLQDLENYAESFANMDSDEFQKLKTEFLDKDDSFNAMSEDDQKQWVEERANDLKRTIKQYRDIYNSIDFLSFGTSSKEAIEELVYTSAQLKNFEGRYNRLLDEVISKVRPTLEGIAAEKKADGSLTERAQKAQNILDKENELRTLFGGFALDIQDTANSTRPTNDSLYAKLLDDAAQAKALADLEELGVFIGAKSNGLKQDVKDLQTLVRSRQTFYAKLFDPKNRAKFGENFEKEAKTPEDVADNIAARKNTEDERLAVGNLKTIEQMHRGYAAARDKGLFLRGLSKRANSDKVAYDFVKMYDSFSTFQKNLMNEHPEIVNKRDGTFSRVANIMLDDLFQKSKSTDELIDNLENVNTDLAAVNDILNQLVSAGEISEDEAMPAMISHMYDIAEKAIKDSAVSYKGAYSGTSGRENVGGTKQEVKQQTPDADNDAPSATVTPKPNTEKQASEKQQSADANKKEDLAQPNEAPEETVEQPTAKDEETDGYSVSQQDSMPEEQAYRTDAKGSVKLGYYQQSVPEVAISKMKDVRDLLNQRKTATKEEMEIIDQQLYSILLDDFVQYNEQGEPVGGAVEYSSTHKWLQDSGSFRYIAQDLNVNDEVVFAIMKDAPQYNGRPQIVVAKVTRRNQSGEIEQVQPLTMLHSLDKTGEYMNLDELYDAILTDYESSEPSGSLYVFGGLNNPHTSRVFGKRPGLVRYDRKSSGKSINEITDYDSEAPIVILDDHNQPVVLRGNVDTSRMFMPNIYPWSAPHTGRVYYMARNGNDTYTPILLSKGTITSSSIEQAPDGSFLSKIRDTVEKIDTITDVLTVDNIDKSNIALKMALKTLNKYINLDGVQFEYYIDNINDNGVPKLNINWGSKEVRDNGGSSSSNDENLVPGESLLSVIDELNRPVRISYKDNLVKESKSNLQSIIEDGLLTSNATELRQVGVNFMFDPWDAGTNTFKRILPQSSEQIKDEKSIPNSENMTVARDAELGEDVDYRAVRRPENFEEEQPMVATGQDNLDDFFDADTTAMNTEMQSDYDSLPESVKQTLEAKGVSSDEWNSDAPPEVRKKWLNC